MSNRNVLTTERGKEREREERYFPRFSRQVIITDTYFSLIEQDFFYILTLKLSYECSALVIISKNPVSGGK